MAETKYLLVAQMDVEPHVEKEFNDWFNRDHIPAVLKVPGVLGVRRYVALQGSPKYTAEYELTSPDIPTSKAWAETRNAGRTAQMRPHVRNSSYRLYRQMPVEK